LKIAIMQIRNDRATWLKGPGNRCSIPPQPQAHPLRLVLLGAPGVGKGTQTELLGKHFGSCQLSTGDAFRVAKSLPSTERGPAMTVAVESMTRGELVSDKIVLSLVAERSQCLRCGGGFLLDGFPRTVAQARALEQLFILQNIQLDAVLDYKLSLKKIIARLSGRRVCPGCKAVFHIESLPPKSEGVCDHCGGMLYQRDDDRPESIRVRMAEYKKNAAPLKRFYQRRNLLVTIEAAGNPEETFERTLEALKSRQPAGNGQVPVRI
jgi:adenylate kinase